MTMRSRRETVTFKHPFRIKGIDRLLPPGAYEVITDEEMIRIVVRVVSPGCHYDHGAGGAAAHFNDGEDFHQFRSIWLTLSALMPTRLVSDEPLDLDKHR
jgi:hypothetical protein